MRRALVLLLAALALVLSACYPASKPVPQDPAPRQGFDAACAPTLDKMTAWWNESPYTSAAIYLGGSSVYCKAQMQPHLTSSWVTSVTKQGWKLIPIWVGPQAPCTNLGDVTKLSADPAAAYEAGVTEAFYAAERAKALGMLDGPIYYDMEYYPSGNPTCQQVIQLFTYGWSQGLHFFGHTAGLYSSLCAGIMDVAIDPTSAKELDGLWIAAWAYNDQNDPRYSTYTPNLFGFSACSQGKLSDAAWANHQRLRQYRGGHDETWGGVTLNIDSNADDGLRYFQWLG